MTEPAFTAVVCDDEPDMLTVFADQAAAAGFEVLGAVDTAIRAIDLTRMVKPSLVIIDQDLPYTTGLDAIPELREASPGVEVLLVTRDETLHDQAMAAGAFGIVYKSRLTELAGALGRAKEFIATADQRDPDERRTGHDRRHHQDWRKVTSERRQGDRRHRHDDDEAEAEAES